MLMATLRAVCWFAFALFVAAWVVHPSGPLGLDETGIAAMDMPRGAANAFTGLQAWFAGAYNYAVRVIQQDAKPGAHLRHSLRAPRSLCGVTTLMPASLFALVLRWPFLSERLFPPASSPPPQHPNSLSATFLSILVPSTAFGQSP